MLSQAFYVIIARGILSPAHVREVLYGLKVIGKIFILKSMPTVQLPGEKSYDTQMVIHNVTCTSDDILDIEFQKQLYSAAHKHEVID